MGIAGYLFHCSLYFLNNNSFNFKHKQYNKNSSLTSKIREAVVYVSKNKNSNKSWKNAGRKNKHHIFAKCRGGTYDTHNIIKWDINQHAAYHYLFGNRTLLEVAAWLTHVDQQKQLGFDTDLKIDD